MNLIKIDNIIRRKRKTIALVINPDATLTVRAPIHISGDYIEQLVHKKRAWIKRKIGEVKARPKIKPKEFVDGEEFFYLGKIYEFKIVEARAISIEDYLYFPRSMLYNAARHLKEWYKAQAAEKIEERAVWHAKETGLNYKSVKITGAQKRWGSCNISGNLNFSWRLVMAPLEIIDYVVVHELAHLKERNHSSRFWREVKAISPGYQESEKWLKDNGYLLKI